MTTDSALSYQSTESLILPKKRRFFPFKIPTFHPQLHNYISTADPDRIYVVVDRVIYSIHISSQKRETLAVIPFGPRCLAAGYGWIAVGGEHNGECAFIKISDRQVRVREDPSTSQPSDIDSALPIDLGAPTRTSQSWLSGDEPDLAQDADQTQLPDVQLHKFGGDIVNSVTIHQLPGDGKGLADEDIVILSNNDKSVTVYSLTRSKVLKVLNHPACMNYAVVSPDSTILAAVGDETRAYFYDVTRDFNTTVLTESGEKLTGWNWDPLRSIEMDIGTRIDDGCCFTIAFSQFSRLCAIGSQSGVITIFDVKKLRDITHEPNEKSSIICQFNSSRLCCNGGAVRCMAFAPEPWDLLVWLEDKGRAGIADVRQGFLRRQIIHLDKDDPEIEEVHTDPILDDSMGLELEIDGRFSPGSGADAGQRITLGSIDTPPNELGGEASENPPLRDALLHDLTDRERLIVEFLNTARWTSRLEEGLTDRRARANAHPHPAPRLRFQGSTDVSNRTSRPTSPLRHGDSLQDTSRDGTSAQPGTSDRRHNARRQASVILSQDTPEARNRTPEAGSSNIETQPSITLSWTASPSEIQSIVSDTRQRAADSSSDQSSSSGNETGVGSRNYGTLGRPSATFDYSATPVDSIPRPRDHQRSRSGHRHTERQDNPAGTRHEPLRISNTELRTNVATERLRRQRQVVNETHNRNHPRYRQQILGIDNTRSPRWIRSILNELPDRSLGVGQRYQEPGTAAGIGWGADGRTLYVATVDGIFEYQLNIADRKTFPVVNYR
ncbi:WD40-repeat-containing domain protein [Aspergillus novoparasiticus]|uniref:WD40-repeat-containing domain protein n=1 Tax=Aspergillus novoparasiticus TaxID=986946 RepID=A0A5N6EZA8_9EURO|nr:WD40-repeat-containing domain protein [Aspergillus novoparasiticus]